MKRWAAAVIAALVIVGGASAQDTLADVVEAGDRDAAFTMIESGADVNAAQADGATALLWAVYRADPELVDALIAAGANADVMNRFGASPLWEAIKLGDADLVRTLLDAGADPETMGEDDQTALMLAVHEGLLQVVEELIARGADVNAQETWRNQTALMWAAAEDQPEIVELLIRHGADVSVRGSWSDWDRQITSEPRAQYRQTGGLTPLLYATRSGCLRCAEAILDAGADVNEATPDGVTPLMLAIDNWNYDIAKRLLDAGANPHVWDWWGRTALYITVDMNSYTGGGGFGSGGFGGPRRDAHNAITALELAQVLLDAGVDPNAQLVLHRPDRSGQGRFVDDALRTGATPLLRATVSGDHDAMRMLLDAGASVDLPNVMGVTPLMVAAGMSVSTRDARGGYRTGPADDLQARAIASIDLLLDAGADINARVTDTSSWSARIGRLSTMTDLQGQTALYAAAGWGWTDVVEHLLERGARVDIEDAFGKSPLDAARGEAGGRPEGANDETAAVIQAAIARQ